jgi:hypothetical protein
MIEFPLIEPGLAFALPVYRVYSESPAFVVATMPSSFAYCIQSDSEKRFNAIAPPNRHVIYKGMVRPGASPML